MSLVLSDLKISDSDLTICLSVLNDDTEKFDLLYDGNNDEEDSNSEDPSGTLNTFENFAGDKRL